MLILDVLTLGALGLTVWAVQILRIPIHAAGTVNGLGHFWGYRNFDHGDASTNVPLWGTITDGEELHSNHHTHATSTKFLVKWYGFDIGWDYICVLEIVGLVKVRKMTPKARFSDVKPINQSTLETIIASHYGVMACYAKMARAVCCQELVKLEDSRAVKYRTLKPACKWFCRDETRLGAPQREWLSQIMSDHSVLYIFAEMRRRLGALQDCLNATRGQLSHQL